MSGLLIRPAPVRGESWQGYLLRMAEHNALGTPTRVKKNWLETGALQGCLRGPISGLGVLNKPDPGGLSMRYWNTRRPRYCPLCLDEAPFWRSAWTLVFYVACHHHHVALVDDCESCGRPLRSTRSSLLQCSCGRDLRRRLPREASPAAIATSSALASAWCDGEVPENASVEGPDVAGLLYRVWLLGAYGSQTADRAQKLSNLHAVTRATVIVEAAAKVTFDWPTGYFAFLDEVADRYGDPASSRLGNRFGAFYKELFGRKAGTALSDLREGFEAYVRERWPGQIAERNRRLRPHVRSEHAWVPITRAAKQLRCKAARLRKLIASGLARGHLTQRSSGRVSGVIHREDLAHLLSEAPTCVDMATVCKLLHIGKKAVHKLVSSGRLPAVSGPTVDGCSIWRFRPSDVEQLRPDVGTARR